MVVTRYQDLEVWQQAMDLVIEVYKASSKFPREEVYGLTAQIRRAAVSVPSNIAEGQGRRSTKDFLHFLSTARGSLMELQTQLEIGRRLELLPEDVHEQLRLQTEVVARLLNGLMRALNAKLEQASTPH